MPVDSSKVRVAITGAVSVGPTTSTAPTTASSALTGFTDLGYVGEDGVTESRGRSTTKIKAWQNADTVREVITEAELTYSFTLIETKKETVELFYGTTVTSTATEGSFSVIPASTGGRRSFVVDVVDGAELIRTYIPSGEVTEVGDVVYASGEPIGYEVTITTYPSGGFSAKKFATALKS